MACLYIKDPATAELAERIARIRGVTKTRAVHDALQTAFEDIRPKKRKTDLLTWIEERRARVPLRPTGRRSDKDFFDAMWGDA